MRKIHLLHRWDAIAMVAWFMYGLGKNEDKNLLTVCEVHSMLIKNEAVQ